MAPIFGEIVSPKEYILTQKITNGPNLITQSEALAPEVIVVDKLWTDISVNSRLTVETRASTTPEKRIPGKKIKIKSPALYPPRKDQNPNQDKNNLGLQKYQCHPPQVFLFYPGLKSFKKESNDDNTQTTDT